MKSFIITVDTEGDNLWRHIDGDPVGVRNAEYLPRFQSLCEKYDFFPVYLTNYEMAQSEVFIKESHDWIKRNTCEIGVHLHAWNNPPIMKLDGPYQGNPYLIEYPEDIMREKFKIIYNLIEDNFGVKPISHRAGRWAMDARYFNILKEFEIKIDCSYTPGINWGNVKGITTGGSNYYNEPSYVQNIDGVLEVPATIRKLRFLHSGSLKYRLFSSIIKQNVWLRPALSSLTDMKRLINNVRKDKGIDFVEFMIHSSEVMPGGSPYFDTVQDINEEYNKMESLFNYAKQQGFVGCTLADYYNNHIGRND